jgi:hypothetical protein
MNSTIEGKTGSNACTVVIRTLEAELSTARALQARYDAGELEPCTLVPVRHLCAGLVETAVELARQVAELGTPAESC